MRAAILERNGPIEDVRVAELDPPKHGSGDVLVRVHAAALNPADVKVVSGKDGGGFIHAKSFPMAIGFDFSGVVEEVGSRLRGLKQGDQVFGFLPYGMWTKQGSLAELVSVKQHAVGRKPPGVSHEVAAAVGTAGCTALQALRDKAHVKEGQRVLVNGASGGVGSHAVQIAKLLGADVWGTASAAKADFVRGLGASRVIDYRQTPMSSIGTKFDVVLDAATSRSFSEAATILEPGGAYVTLLPSLGLLTGIVASVCSSKRCAFVGVKPRAADLEQLADWLATGKLTASVERTYPLSEITDALTSLASGSVRGKLAVRVRA